MNVTCHISNGTVYIEREGVLVGRVDDCFGQPTLFLNTDPTTFYVVLTKTDCDIIWDNWNFLMESKNTKQR